MVEIFKIQLLEIRFALDQDGVMNQVECPLSQVYTVCGIYTGCAVVAVIIIIVLLDKIKLDKDNHDQYGKFSFDLVIATFKHWWNSPYQRLLVVLTFYSGVEQGFVGGDFTKVAFFTCKLENSIASSEHVQRKLHTF